ncbi:MAG: hypothetical protein ACYTEL_18270 [Planctomycetota bacterium]|jgi:hypothetical protein
MRIELKILLVMAVLLPAMVMPRMVRGEDWKHQVVFPDDPYCADGVSAGDPGWVKFTIKLDDPCTRGYAI